MAERRFAALCFSALAGLMLLTGCGPRHGGFRAAAATAAAEQEAALEALLEGQYLTHEALAELLEISRAQGTGEITLFFDPAEARLGPGDEERERLVRFLDSVQAQARGREVQLVCIGSASAPGPLGWNRNLAERRARGVRSLIDHYLVNTPHTFLGAYGLGTTQSPTGVGWRMHQRYQHVRVIAVYDRSQLPELPGNPPQPAAGAPLSQAAPPSPWR
jgi:hypothetical protein